MKILLLLLSWCLVLPACTIAITSPTASQSVSGFAGPGSPSQFYLSSSPSSCPTINHVQYLIDGISAYSPGWGEPYSNSAAAQYAWGMSNMPPYSMPWNSYWSAPGPHTASVIAYDVNDNTLATSSGVSFTVANLWPVSCSGSPPASTLSFGSVSGGQLPATLAVTGSCSGDSKAFNFYIDGIAQPSGYGGSATASSFAVSLDETQFPNGIHNICASWSDATNFTYYPTPNNSSAVAGDPCAQVTFANGALPMEVWTAASAVYLLTGGSTFSLAPTLYNTDGTTTSGTAFDYLSSNPSVASVNSSGVVSPIACPSASVSSCSAQIYTMAETEAVHCTDLTVGLVGGANPLAGGGDSTCYPFKPSDTGRLIKIVSGTNCNVGVYLITDITINGGMNVANTNGNLGTVQGALCGFVLGQTATSWAFVSATNAVSCFGTDGTIHSTYDAACFFPNEMFQSADILGPSGISFPAPYTYRGSTGPLSEIDAVNGLNTWELGIIPSVSSNYSSSSLASFQTAETSYLNGFNSAISALLHAKFWYGTGDGIMRQPIDLWNSTQGVPSNWSTPILPAALSLIQSTLTNPMIGIAMMDEVNSYWGGCPTCGPQVPSGSNGQLVSITAAAGVCTISMSGLGISFNSGSYEFTIHGSSTTALNNSGASYYTYVPGTTSFACTGVSNGTYSDSGLTIEPYAWFGASFSGGTLAYITNNAFATLTAQANTLGSGRIPWGAPPQAAENSCSAMANWNGNSTTAALGGITNFSNYADFYPAAIGGTGWLVAHSSMRALVIGSQEMGYNLRAYYGCYNPALPLAVLTNAIESGTSTAVLATTPVASISNSTLTFSSAHGVKNIVPGETRLGITGNSNSSANTAFYASAVLGPTSLSVALAASDFTSGTCTGATLTFSPSGYVESSVSITASGTNLSTNIEGANYGQMFGDVFTTATVDTNLIRHRGETFTVAGCASPWSSHTFIYLPENIGVSITQGFFRELPSYSGTGGTSAIQPDSTPIRGRYPFQPTFNEVDPASILGRYYEAGLVNHARMTRLYVLTGAHFNYGSANGFVGLNQNDPTYFSPNNAGLHSTTADTNVQFSAFPHWEESAAVPNYHAAQIGAAHLVRYQSLLLQPSLNSPDYGQRFSAGASGGANGNILFFWNDTDAAQTQAFTWPSSYLISGQQIEQEYVCADGTDVVTLLSAGTLTTGSLTMNRGCGLFLAFWADTVTSVQLASFSPNSLTSFGDCPSGTTSISIRWGYDQYLLDAAASNVASFTSFPAVIPADRNAGTIYGRVSCVSSTIGALLTSSVQTF